MIIGIGIDVVGVQRFDDALVRTPALARKLFVAAERDMPVASLAARFAAKEAFVKALGGPSGMSWHEVVVVGSTPPRLRLQGVAATKAAQAGVASTHLSLTHDAGVAAAVVILEG